MSLIFGFSNAKTQSSPTHVNSCKNARRPIDKHLLSDLLWKRWIERSIKPYFLAPYTEGKPTNAKERCINGASIKVERYKHGLAHGLRQGALAKDIVILLALLKENKLILKNTEDNAIIDWAHKMLADKSNPNFLKKLELVSSFQRSGRQSDASHLDNLEAYKKYERQDAINFSLAAKESGIFDSDLEIQIFSETLLWSNPGILSETVHEDLKYLRRVVRSAHTLDLRRLNYFEATWIRQISLEQIFKHKNLPMHGEYQKLIEALWKRSGEYLSATGDRDLVDKRAHSNDFFLQTKYPYRLVNALHSVAKNLISYPN